MLPIRPRSPVVLISLFSMLLAISAESASCRAGAEGGDLVSHFADALPSGWSASIVSSEGKCFVDITTPPMETEPSASGNSAPRFGKTSVVVTVLLLAASASSALFFRFRVFH
jgi:hypothetical protein